MDFGEYLKVSARARAAAEAVDGEREGGGGIGGGGGGEKGKRGKDQKVRLQNKDGTTEEVTAAELHRRAASFQQGFQMKEGMLMRDHSGSFNVSNITDPGLKRFVSACQFAVASLQRQNLVAADAALGGLESLPPGGLANATGQYAEVITDKRAYEVRNR